MATHNLTPASDESDSHGDEEAGHPFEDLATAIIFIVVGVGAFVIALEYPGGSLHRMGPGIFPMMVAGLMTAIGLGLAIESLVAWRLRPVSGVASKLIPNFSTVRALVFVMLSLLAFALLVRPAGLFLATAALTFIATRAESGRSVVKSLILSVLLSSISAVIFVYGIGLPIPLWP